MKTEADVRRLFREHGFEVVRVRHRKHWTVHGRAIGGDRVIRFTLSVTTNDQNVLRIIRGDIKRASVDRNKIMKGIGS
jgi:hypothetical protein